MQNKIFSKAASGEQAQASATLNGAARVDIDVEPADRLNLHSPRAALAARKRAGNALELEFEDGQLVSLEGFYAPQHTEAVPTLVVSTGEVKEVFVGAVEGSAEVAQGSVEGTTLPAQATGPCEVRQQQGVDAFGGPNMVGGPGELFTGFPEDTSRLHPYCGNGMALGDGFSETPQAMAGSDNDEFLMGLVPFAPQFLAFASLFSAAAVAAAVTSNDEPAVTPPATPPAPTMTIDAISTDSGDSDKDFITNDTSLTVSGNVKGLTAGQRVQVSGDGGATWNDAVTLTNGNWSYADPAAHESSFTYQARVIDSSNAVVATVSHAVTVDTHASDTPVDGVTLAITGVTDNVERITGHVSNGGATNDSTPTLTGTLAGTLAPDEVIAIFRNGTRVGKATLTGTDWTFTDGNLADAAYSYEARVMDIAGNQGAASEPYAITVDTHASGIGDGVSVAITGVTDDAAPIVGAISNGGVTNDTTPTLAGTLTGTLTPDEVIAIYRGSTRVGTATITGSSWSYTDNMLTEGAYTYVARVEDAAGNQGASSASYSITVDISVNGVAVAITGVDDNADPVRGTVAGGGATNDSTPTLRGSFAGTLLPDESIIIYRDNVRLGAAIVAADGSWSYVDSGLADGSHTYVARVEDRTGNQGATSTSYAIIVDTVPPTTTATFTVVNDNADAVASGGATNDATPTLKGITSVPLAPDEVLVIYRDGVKIATVPVAADGSWTYPDTPLTDGDHDYMVRVEDAAGNQGPISLPYAVTVDTLPPDAAETVAITAISTDTGSSATDFITSDTTLTVSGTNDALSAGNKIQVSSNGGATWTDVVQATATTWTFDDTATAHTATFTYQVRVIDTAGNVGNTASQQVVIDTAAPAEAVTITAISTDSGSSASDFITSDTSLTVSGTNTALASGSRIQVSSNGGTTWADATVSGASWTYVDPTAHPTTFTYQVRVIDTAGSVGNTASQQVVIDTAAPAAPTIDNTRGDTVSGDATAGVTVRVSVNGAFAGTATANASGRWTYDLSPDAANGATISAQAVDTAGNQSSITNKNVDALATIQIGSPLMGDNIFNDSEAGTVQISGTTTDVEAGRVVQLTLTDASGKVFNATATVAANGSWTTPINLSTASHGYITVNASVSDQLGNVGAATASNQLQFVAPIDIINITEDTGISSTDLLTSDTGFTVVGKADPSGTVTLTGTVRYYGQTGGFGADEEPVYGVATYNLNQVVTVNADGTWQTQLLFGSDVPNQPDLAGQPIQVLDTNGQSPYTLTATWTQSSTLTDTVTVSVDTVAPDLFTQAVGATAERQVNTYIKSNQMASRVVGLNDGGYMIIWTSKSQENSTANNVGVYGQRYDASGNKIGGETLINTFIVGGQGLWGEGDYVPHLDIVADPNGGFVVVYSGGGQPGGSYDIDNPAVRASGGAYNIWGQRFNANGQKITTDIDGSGSYAAANEFIVSSSWNTGTWAYVPRVTALEGGQFVVVWSTNATSSTGFDVRAQLFNAAWQRVGGEIHVTDAAGDQGFRRDTGTDNEGLSVTALAGGGFKVSYSDGSSQANSNIYTVDYTSTGQVVANSLHQVNTSTDRNQLGSASATLADGSTIVVWYSNQGGSTGYNVYSQRYKADGTANGTETVVNAFTAGNQGTLSDNYQQLAVTALDSGGYVVVWAGRGATSLKEDNIYMRVYSDQGVPRTTTDILVNQVVKGVQQLPHVAALDGGGFIVTWSAQYGGTDQGTDYAVMQRAYNDDGTLRAQALDSPETLVNVGATTNSQFGTSVSASATNKNVAVSWIERNTANNYAFVTANVETTKAALFDLAGRKIVSLAVADIAGVDGTYSGLAGKAAQILSLSNGTYVLVREVQNQTDGDVYASIYNANGSLARADFVATSATSGEQNGPTGLVELKGANGQGTGQWAMLYTGAVGGGSVLQPQLAIFNADGTDALPGNDIVVSNHAPASNQGFIGSGAWEGTSHIAASNGRFAVVWSDSVGADGNGDGVYLQIFTNAGVKGTEVQVNVSTSGNQSGPKVAALADGSFLVTWTSNHVSSGVYDVYMQRFSSTGARFSAEDELVSAGFPSGNQGAYGTGAAADRSQQIDVVALAGGGWVITFVNESPVSDTANNGSRDVFANIYDAAGNLMQANIQLAAANSGSDEYYPTLSALVDGGFVASWTSTTKLLGDSSGSGTYMRFFDAAGHVRSLNEYHPADAAIRIEPNILVGGSPDADAYNTAQQAADPSFDVANDGLSANGDTPSSLWKAEVTITNYRTGDTLGWDAALAISSGISAAYDGEGHLTMLIGSSSTLAGIESVLRSVTYSGGANPAAGDRTIQFSLTDKAGAVTTQDSGITVSSPALSLVGTAGNDTLTGGNGHDGLITNGGIDTVSGGAGDDRIYESNSTLAGQYNGGSGFDTLVVDFTGTQTVNMTDLATHARGIERIDLGNSAFKTNNTTLQIDTLASVQGMIDVGTTKMLVQGDSADTVRLANATDLHKVSVSSQDGVYFDIYQTNGSDLQLWLQQGLQITAI